MDSYDVRFWDTKKIADNASGGRYRVRWAVNGQEHCKSFKNKTLADGFLDNLKDAARDRRPFSPRTGLPAAEPAEEEMVTWYEHARSYADPVRGLFGLVRGLRAPWNQGPRTHSGRRQPAIAPRTA